MNERTKERPIYYATVMVSPFPTYRCGGVTVIMNPLGRGMLALPLRSIYLQRHGRVYVVLTRVSNTRE